MTIICWSIICLVLVFINNFFSIKKNPIIIDIWKQNSMNFLGCQTPITTPTRYHHYHHHFNEFVIHYQCLGGNFVFCFLTNIFHIWKIESTRRNKCFNIFTILTIAKTTTTMKKFQISQQTKKIRQRTTTTWDERAKGLKLKKNSANQDRHQITRETGR